ncbi:LuxR C-terminal-related transcriptional regulator [Streptomyces yangpuensis]|uniref:LuxR C-terminal-related transcriptional regulator n=1 Tax=Streptomyces yangpuensis TaxID=1648182 RepID=UPI0038212008
MEALIEIGCIDDDLMQRQGMAAWLKTESELRVVATAASVAEFLAGPARPRVVTLDLHLANGTLPADNVATLVEAGHRVVVVTVLPEHDWVQETTEAGASAYLHKSTCLETLVSVIREVQAGGIPTTADHAGHLARDRRPGRPHLSPRELEILEMVSTGMTHESIARRFGCGATTVGTHLAKVRAKYRQADRNWEKAADYHDWVRERRLDRGRLDPLG